MCESSEVAWHLVKGVSKGIKPRSTAWKAGGKVLGHAKLGLLIKLGKAWNLPISGKATLHFLNQAAMNK